jgi:multisubunit Na+/H+ antiporter MnhE subunit
MIAGGNVSWLYVFFGILASAAVSVVSSRLNLIEKKSELLHLSFGFYRHFFKIFVRNFFSAIKLIIALALTNKQLHPLIYKVKLDLKNDFNPALLMASFNMTTGLFCIGMKNQEMLIHAIDEDFFRKFDLQKTCLSLSNVNDDNLV